MFFSWEKHLISHFLGFFEGPRLFYVKIAPRFAQDNLDVKKVSAPSKNLSKLLIMCFSRLKNIKSLTFKINGTLIVKLCFTKSLPHSQSLYFFNFCGPVSFLFLYDCLSSVFICAFSRGLDFILSICDPHNLSCPLYPSTHLILNYCTYTLCTVPYGVPNLSCPFYCIYLLSNLAELSLSIYVWYTKSNLPLLPLSIYQWST
jgi:hypothetical protein